MTLRWRAIMPLCLIFLMSFAVDGRIAVTATADNPESRVETLFGRSRWILIYDTRDGTWQTIDNSEAMQAAGGAGVQTGELLRRRGVTIVLTGQCGSKALDALSSAGIKVFRVSGGTVAEALRDYREGRLKPIGSQ